MFDYSEHRLIRGEGLLDIAAVDAISIARVVDVEARFKLIQHMEGGNVSGHMPSWPEGL